MSLLSDTSKIGYRFKNQVDAQMFALSFSPKPSYSIKKGLPLWKGQANTGWTLFVKARTIADELQIQTAYKKLDDSLKVVHP